MLKTLTSLALLVALAACAPPYASEDVVDEDADATGENGTRGPYGVERVTLLSLGVDVEVTVPIGDDAHHTPVIVVQGGAVAKERYRWLSEHLSTRGFTVLNTQHASDLAILDVGASLRALAFARDEPQLEGQIADTPGVVMGHSLGGVIGAKLWNQAGSDELKHLALLASLPDAADVFSDDGDGDRIVLSLWGTENGRTTSEEFFDGSRAFVDAASVHTVTIEGMNHYQFVSDPTEAELADDGVATIDIDTAQQTALEVIDRLCDDAAGTDAFETPPLLPWPNGVETFEG